MSNLPSKFDKRRLDRKPRQHGFKTPRADSFLIISEGEETEPLYFNGFGKIIEKTIGGKIDSVNIPYINAQGKGRSTYQLLTEVDKIVSKSRIMYQYIWVLFDKDQFEDFDEAIDMGKDKGYSVGWSNYCFEYWLCLHFNYLDSALDASALEDCLSKIYKSKNIANGKYLKNDSDVFDNVGGIEGVKKAVKFAQKRMASFDNNLLPSKFNPGTTVYKLADKLLSYL